MAIWSLVPWRSTSQGTSTRVAQFAFARPGQMIQSAGKFQGHWQRVPRDWASGTRRVPFAGKDLLVRRRRAGRRAGRGRSRRRPGRAGDGGRRAAGRGRAREPGPRARRHPQFRWSLPGRPGDGQPGAGRPQESRTDLRPADRPRHPPRQQPGRPLAAARRGAGGRRALARRCGAPHAGHHLHGLHRRRQRHAAAPSCRPSTRPRRRWSATSRSSRCRRSPTWSTTSAARSRSRPTAPTPPRPSRSIWGSTSPR